MSDQAQNAAIAIVLGIGLAILLFAPTAAYQYRLDGRLGAKDLAVLVSGAVYSFALWTYTLLPLPEPGYRCQGRQLEPLASIVVIGPDDAGGVLGLLRDPAFLQVALNVLLFVPFGFFVRIILKRGVLVSLGLGLATSLLIETTQTTGDWGIYPCAYRLFDVDDLLVNTLGAVLGSLLSFVFADRRDESTPPLPTRISLGRRLVGMASDLIFIALLGGAVAAAYRGFARFGPGGYDTDVATALLLGVPFVVEAVAVLAWGRTVGEYVVAVRAVRRRRVPPLLARTIKLLTGLTPVFALVLAGDALGPTTYVGVPVLAVLHLVLVLRTREHRGLSHALAGLDLRIDTTEAFDREPVGVSAPDTAPEAGSPPPTR